MMTARRITKIEAQKKNKNRISIYLDDEFAFGLSADVLVKFGLASGIELSPEEIDTIQQAEAVYAAKARAMSLLTYRPRSVNEIRSRLREKKFSETAIENAVHDLLRAGLLNDEQFAISFARSRLISRPSGSRLLIQELKGKGIDEQYIEKALIEAFSERGEPELAASLAEKQKPRPGDDPVKGARRLSDFLLRRGFSWEIIKPIVDEYFKEAEQKKTSKGNE